MPKNVPGVVQKRKHRRETVGAFNIPQYNGEASPPPQANQAWPAAQPNQAPQSGWGSTPNQGSQAGWGPAPNQTPQPAGWGPAPNQTPQSGWGNPAPAAQPSQPNWPSSPQNTPQPVAAPGWGVAPSTPSGQPAMPPQTPPPTPAMPAGRTSTPPPQTNNPPPTIRPNTSSGAFPPPPPPQTPGPSAPMAPGSMQTAYAGSPASAPAIGLPVARLLIELDGKVVGEARLNKPTLTIGRLKDNDVQVANQRVSRLHARLHAETGGWAIEDAESVNGVILNGQRVKRQLLKHGDRVYLSPEAVLVYEQQP